MLSASVTSFGRAFHWRVLSGKNPRWYAKVCVYGTRNWALPVLLLAGGCVMCDVVRCQDVNKTMNYPVHFGWDDNVNYQTRPRYLDE